MDNPSDKITVSIDTIKPEWFRREIIEAISSGKEVTFSIYHGGRKFLEYPVQLVDRRQHEKSKS